MRKRPLLLCACVFVLGILFERTADGRMLLTAACVSGYSLTPFLRRGWELYSSHPAADLAEKYTRRQLAWRIFYRALVRVICVGTAFFAGMSDMRLQTDFRRQELAQIQEGADISLCGEIAKKEFKQDQYLVYLKNCYAVSENGQTACNGVLLYQTSDDYSIGDILIVKGKVHMFSSARNEGSFDRRSYYFAQKIDFYFRQASVRLAARAKNPLPEQLWRLRRKALAVYQGATDEVTEGLLAVMLLGEKSDLDEEVKLLYQSMGISHILAISGLHVSLIGLGLYRFLRRRGICYRRSFAISFVLLLLYAMMTGQSVSTVRAVGMLALLMLADWCGRAYDVQNSLGAMCLLLLHGNPFLLDYTGFVLSFLAVLGTATIGNVIAVEFAEDRQVDGADSAIAVKADKPLVNSGRIPAKVDRLPFFRKAVNAAYTGIGIWLFTLPAIACCFYEIPLYAAFLNLFVVPLLPILLFAGLAAAIAGIFGMNLSVAAVGAVGMEMSVLGGKAAALFLLPCRWILVWYETAANICEHLPLSKIIVGKPTAGKLTCFYLLLLICCVAWKKFKKSHLLRIAGVAVILAVLLTPAKEGFELDVLDVGQGDGIYLCTKDGISLFFDGGSSNIRQVGTYRILPFLKSKGIRHIEYWFVSHADSDHISGLVEVLESGYPVEHVVVQEERDAELEKLCTLAGEHGADVLVLRAGDVLRWKKSQIICLAPLRAGADSGRRTSADRNDSSLVLLYQDNDFSGMFAGDITEETERALLVKYGAALLDVDFYKVNHHGSRYSSSREWLTALSPELAVISCSSTNVYGHPHEETLARLKEGSCGIYRTDESGEIMLRLQEGKIAVESFVQP